MDGGGQNKKFQLYQFPKGSQLVKLIIEAMAMPLNVNVNDNDHSIGGSFSCIWFCQRKSEIVGVGRLFKLSIHLQKEKKKEKKKHRAVGMDIYFWPKKDDFAKTLTSFFFFKVVLPPPQISQNIFFFNQLCPAHKPFFFLLVFSLMLKVLLLLFYFGKITRYHFKLCSRLHFTS